MELDIMDQLIMVLALGVFRAPQARVTSSPCLCARHSCTLATAYRMASTQLVKLFLLLSALPYAPSTDLHVAIVRCGQLVTVAAEL